MVPRGASPAHTVVTKAKASAPANRRLPASFKDEANDKIGEILENHGLTGIDELMVKDGGERITGEYMGRQWAGWTDSRTIWKPVRS